MIEVTHPVIGPLRPWDMAVWPTKFQSFDNGQVRGMAWIKDRDIEFLAVASHHPGMGQFREFIRELKTHYNSIRFWAMLNGQGVQILWRYGFKSGYDTDEYSQVTDCMDWRKQDPTTL